MSRYPDRVNRRPRYTVKVSAEVADHLRRGASIPFNLYPIRLIRGMGILPSPEPIGLAVVVSLLIAVLWVVLKAARRL